MTAIERPRPVKTRVGPGAHVGVTEAMIRELVHRFYARIRTDPALGHIFNRVIGDNWDTHLGRMCDFWSSVLLMTGRFKGAPMVAHSRIPEIRSTHFARWLHLFRQTAEEVCPLDAAALFVAKSEMIAQSLQLWIASSRGQILPVESKFPSQAGGWNEAEDKRAGLSPAPHRRASDVSLMILPSDVQPYRSTEVFTETTVPPGLLRAHATRDGAWGLIHVLEGRLAYRIIDPRRPRSEHVLKANMPPGVVEPTILHEVEPIGPVRFYVEFHSPKAAPQKMASHNPSSL